MSSELVVRARGLGKCYPIFARPEDRLKQMFWRHRRIFFTPFWAVRGVDLALRRGETLGVVGRNGSGKSTLLKLIYGTLEPNEGEIEVGGRVAALLELGAGFNPEFTGRENCTLSASILGIDPGDFAERFAAVEAFADIGEFIDRPVKSYSAGMYARLAFAVAVHVDADVLLVDEVLAVGDEAFQRKCYKRIDEFKAGGGSIVLVTHSTQAILERCDRVLLMDAGEALLTASPPVATTRYLRLLHAPPDRAQAIRDTIRAEGPGAATADEAGPFAPPEATADEAHFDPALRPATTVEYDPHGARIRDPVVLTPEGARVNCLTTDRHYRLRYLVEFEKDGFDVRFHTLLKTVSGLELGGATYPGGGATGLEVHAGLVMQVEFGFQCRLNQGVYFLNCGVTGNGEQQLHRIVDALAIRVLPAPLGVGFGYVGFSFAGTTSPVPGAE